MVKVEGWKGHRTYHNKRERIEDTETYTPNPNFSGQDSFSFTVSDVQAASAPATVTVDVSPSTPGTPSPRPGDNEIPVAQDQRVSTEEDTPVTITLQASDLDGDPLTYVLIDQPSKGTLGELDPATNQVTYTPDENENGQDSFSFQANDGVDVSNIATI